MKRYWHTVTLAAIAVAVLCLFLFWLTGDEGVHTFKLFGWEFGYERIKIYTFIYLFGDRHEFPVHSVLIYTLGLSVGVAVVFVLGRLMFRRSDA